MLQEIVEPISNPKYIIVRKSKPNILSKCENFHSVPENFENQWINFVRKYKLIYTRTIEGRKNPLTTRSKPLSAQFEDISTDRINKWK